MKFPFSPYPVQAQHHEDCSLMKTHMYNDTHEQHTCVCMLAHTLPVFTGMHYHTHTQCYCYAAIFYADDSRTCLRAHSHNTHILITGLFNNGICHCLGAFVLNSRK